MGSVAAAQTIPAEKRYAVPVVIGFAPVVTILLTWVAPGETISTVKWLIKSLAVPAVAAEIFVIAFAVREKLRYGIGSRAPSPRGLFCLLALLAIAIVTAQAATETIVAYVRTGLWIVHFWFAWSLSLICGMRPTLRKSLTDAVLAGFIVSAILSSLFVLLFIGSGKIDWMNGLPGFDNIRRMAYYAAPIFGLCLARFALAADRRAWLITLAACSLVVAVIVWNGARGAIAASIGAYFVGAALFPRLRQAPVFAGVAMSGLLGTAIASAAPSPANFMGVTHLTYAQIGGDGVSPSSGMTSGRFDLWLNTLAAIAERPLFGHGEGQLWFVVPIAKTFDVAHPHNLLLQILFAWGAVGTLLLVLLAIPFALRTIRTVRDHGGEFLPPFMAMLVLLLYSGVDGTLFHVQAASLFAAFAGAVTLSSPVRRATLPERTPTVTA